jgi:Lon protease-like protein
MGSRRPLVTDLPALVPVFPVPGALLLPGGRLPLTVFEQRYMALIDDAMGLGRLFGMVQPAEGGGEGAAHGLFRVGCLGRVTSFAETGDGRYLVTVQGLCRFDVLGEAEGRAGYRRLKVDYRPYAADLDEQPPPPLIDRDRLMSSVRAYFADHGIAVNWAVLDEAADLVVVTTLAMTCPFSPEEKQALLEAGTVAERAAMMTAMIEMSLLSERSGGTMPVH